MQKALIALIMAVFLWIATLTPFIYAQTVTPTLSTLRIVRVISWRYAVN